MNDSAPLNPSLSVPEALAMALDLHRNNRLEAARTLYERIVKIHPDLAEAWHFLGMLEFQQGNSEAGMAAVQQSLHLCPTYADAHANLANMLLQVPDLTRAQQHLEHAIELSPQALPPRLTLGILKRVLGQHADSERILTKLLVENPASAVVHHAMGHTQAALGEVEEAVRHYSEAIVLDPLFGRSRERLVNALLRLGRKHEAVAQLEEWIAEMPDDPTPCHLLAACGHVPTPARAEDRYVRKLFDSFASSFDSQLESLNYRAPELIGSRFEEILGSANADLEILDAGCGTGLLGPYARPFAQTLVGVDLSPRMLERARNRGQLYDRLEEAELTAYLEKMPGRFDMVASADTLCYFGELSPFANVAAGALKRHGWLLFTVEHEDGTADGFRLQYHGRYSHDRSYIERVLANAGFSIVRIDRHTLREEGGKPVPGLVVCARKEH